MIAPRLPSTASSRGLVLAVGAHGVWGFLPLYFLLLIPSSAVEIVAWRIILSLAFCIALLFMTGAFRRAVLLVRDRQVVALSLLAGIFISLNWTVYVYGTTNGFVVDTALGYFINPIVSIALGVIFLRERLRLAQWAAVSISVMAVLVLTVGSGRPPWIALALAFSFGFYGFIKNRMGGRVSAVAGLTLETAWLVPAALVALVIVEVAGGGITMGREGIGHALLLSSAGVVTAVPLLLFASASGRLPLSVMGFIQYVTPLLQFAFGVIVMLEPMPLERWAGFALVWVALMVLTADALRQRRRALRGKAADPAPLTGPMQTV